jgi:dTDP-4-dehydrorhamnose 3,5-epimerase-like enzyme
MQGSAHVPFVIARIFTVHASKGTIRGRHAHKRCSQFMVCSAGRVQVVCDDGTHTASFVLDQKNFGLFVPAGIWAHQSYQQDDSVLMVLCDRAYEAEDYVRDYSAFLAYRCP